MNVLPAEEEDYFNVKGAERSLEELSWCSRRGDQFILKFPVHMVRETVYCANNLQWSFNPSIHRQTHQG